MPLVDMVEPPLTTVRIGHVAMGSEAARLLTATPSRERKRQPRTCFGLHRLDRDKNLDFYLGLS